MRHPIRIGRKEGWEMLKAWLAISVAFTIILINPLAGKNFSFGKILTDFIVAGITVGLGFLLHELGHKLMARKYGCEEEFKSDNMMLLLALVMSIFGFVFAAPGAVQIKGYVSKVQQGLIALAGPLMNLILALAFLPGLFLFNGQTLLGFIFLYGFLINSWLGLFNMIPVGPFDGAKIYRWNKKAYYIVAILLLLMTLFGMFMQ
jgi:Zn-dependent protease